jgi:DNA-binding NtrC family response regulator
VRIIAATNIDLEARVADGRFRADLFYRLDVVRLVPPPLRERPGDVALLAQHFLKRAARRHGSAVDGFSEAAMARLLAHPWPGNVRELANTIERAVILGGGPAIDAADLPPGVANGAAHAVAGAPAQTTPATSTDGPLSADALTLDEVQRRHILAVLARVGGNQSKAARELGLKRTTLLNRMQRLGIAPAEAP